MSGLAKVIAASCLLAAMPALAQASASVQRVLADGTAVRAALDEERNELVLHVEAAGKPAVERRYRPDNQVLENICLSVQDAGLAVFAVSDRGYLGHWQLIDTRIELVRTLPGIVEGKDCFVDDASAALYVLEEGIGIWRYSAEPGADYARELLVRFAPSGPLDPEMESFHVAGGALMVGEQAVAQLADASAADTLAAVFPVVETEPVPMHGDSADDPVIWRNSKQPELSRVLGTDKRFGLRVYDLEGEELQALTVGRINNVDLRELDGHGRFTAIAAGSNRTRQSISLFGITAAGAVEWLESAEIATGLDDPYGLCMYQRQGVPHVFVNDKDGRMQLWQLQADGSSFKGRLLWDTRLADQPEGCVADDAHARLFFGIEDSGLYTMAIDPVAAQAPRLLVGVDGTELHADVEGMDLYLQGEGGYLLVSSQGNDSFAVYDRLTPHRHRGSFKVLQNTALQIDGVSDTDGLAVHSGNLGERFPRGVLVLQDGYNVLPRENQNFKLLDWRDVAAALQLD